MALLILFDSLTLLFFIVHLPVSVIVDSQVLFPTKWYPKWATDIVEDYITDSGDPLMSNPELWFASLVACELVFQVPFFVCGVWCYLTKQCWIRIPAILYSVHTCTTMIPIVSTLIIKAMTLNPDSNDSNFNLGQMLMTYIPFFLLPLFVGIRWIMVNRAPFSGDGEMEINHSKVKNM
eukprot:g6991.t1